MPGPDRIFGCAAPRQVCRGHLALRNHALGCRSNRFIGPTARASREYENGERRIFDERLPGFGLRLRASSPQKY